MDIKKVVVPFIIALFILLPKIADLWVDYLWYSSIGYLSVFMKILTTKLFLGVAGLVFTTLFLWLNLKFAGKRIDLEDLRLKTRLKGFELFGIVSIGIGIVSAFLCSSTWMTVLKFFNSTTFNKVDPVFAKDLSFYFFKLPFWKLTLNYFSGLFLLSVTLVGLFYLLSHQKKTQLEEETSDIIEKAKPHLYPLLGIFFIVLSGRLYLEKYSVLFSGRGAVFGAAYTDLHVTLPMILIASLLSFLAGIALIVDMKLRKMKLVTVPILSLIGVLIVGSLAGFLVQSYQVEPDEYSLEKKYISRNINNTLHAYRLNDVETKQFPVKYNLSYSEVNRRNETVKNIRLWDHRALKDTYSQLQLIRTYYNFHDVDVDRYHLNGNYQEVMLSTRELNQEDLSEGAKTWVNRHLVYTHGSGLVMSPVSKVSPEGLPIYYLKDIPTQVTSSAPSGESINIQNPDVYYGEETDSFVITNTNTEEFDYPKGDENVYGHYKGRGGIKIGNLFNKLAMAIHFGDIKIMLSGIKPNSKILFRRKIKERTGKIAPFLRYDHDPYPVVHKNRIFWIQDAYTTSNSYPYSEPFGDFNYIRNSVKVAVDAYNGNVSYYVVNEGPLIKTYGKIFPDLFKDFKKMPDKLKKHIRYPEDLFKVQSKIYSTYHMKDSRVFYNKEDKWTVPKELYKDRSQSVEPYYVTLKLPGENETQFILMRPFTPQGKNNMIAWMGGKSDTPSYGEKVVYQFSKQRLIYGPSQIESRISQDSEISQQITLWSQSGSEVIRGNLLVIPIKDSVLYVEPLFLRSSEDAIPELKRVIVAYGDRIAMEPTLRGSLEKIFMGKKMKKEKEKPPEEQPELSQEELLDKAKSHYENAQRYLKQGNFSAYGEEIEKLGKVLEKLET